MTGPWYLCSLVGNQRGGKNEIKKKKYPDSGKEIEREQMGGKKLNKKMRIVEERIKQKIYMGNKIEWYNTGTTVDES